MRTNIVIDDELMEDALRLSGLKTKREAVDRRLRLLTQVASQRRLLDLYGKLPWDGDLDALRTDAPS